MMNPVRGPLLVTSQASAPEASHCVAWATVAHCGPIWARQAERAGYADQSWATVGHCGPIWPRCAHRAHDSAFGSALRLACACLMPVPAAPAARCAPGGLPGGRRHGFADAMAEKSLMARIPALCR